MMEDDGVTSSTLLRGSTGQFRNPDPSVRYAAKSITMLFDIGHGTIRHVMPMVIGAIGFGRGARVLSASPLPQEPLGIALGRLPK